MDTIAVTDKRIHKHLKKLLKLSKKGRLVFTSLTVNREFDNLEITESLNIDYFTVPGEEK